MSQLNADTPKLGDVWGSIKSVAIRSLKAVNYLVQIAENTAKVGKDINEDWGHRTILDRRVQMLDTQARLAAIEKPKTPRKRKAPAKAK